MRRVYPAILMLAISLVLAACSSGAISPNDLYPGQVGSFLRVSGPISDPETGADVAIYQGPPGTVRLNTRRVGVEMVPTALEGLPPGAANVSADSGLGERDGVFFTFGGEYQAAWGNGDWVFVISATTDEARRAFLSGYGF